MKQFKKSAKLANVLYDIRGPIMDAAKQMEEEGQKIIKLNIGNLAVFGFDAPEEIQQDMIRNLPNSAGYSDSKGVFAARADHHAALDLFVVDRDPAGAVCGEGLDVGFVGLELHRGTGNCGQIIGFPQ